MDTSMGVTVAAVVGAHRLTDSSAMDTLQRQKASAKERGAPPDGFLSDGHLQKRT